MKTERPFKNLNKDLVRKTREFILLEPHRFDMSIWGWDHCKAMDPCGSVGCIAGTAWVIHQREQGVTDMAQIWESFNSDRAALVLGIRTEEEYPDQLFILSEWPTEFRTRYEEAAYPHGKAQVAAEYLTWLIGEDVE